MCTRALGCRSTMATPCSASCAGSAASRRRRNRSPPSRMAGRPDRKELHARRRGRQAERATLGRPVPPSSWVELVGQCRAKLSKTNIIERYHKWSSWRTNFSAYVCERTFALLDVLEEYMTAHLPNGERSPRCHEIVQTHFTGDKAWFSDESEANKQYFRDEMTFVDPTDLAKRIFAPWHGKIKTPQYRVHIEWPAPRHTNRIKVLYIGPKITKN